MELSLVGIVGCVVSLVGGFLWGYWARGDMINWNKGLQEEKEGEKESKFVTQVPVTDCSIKLDALKSACGVLLLTKWEWDCVCQYYDLCCTIADCKRDSALMDNMVDKYINGVLPNRLFKDLNIPDMVVTRFMSWVIGPMKVSELMAKHQNRWVHNVDEMEQRLYREYIRIVKQE